MLHKKKFIVYYLALALTVAVMALVSHVIIYKTMYARVTEGQYQELIRGAEKLSTKLSELAENIDELYYFTDSIWLMGKKEIQGEDFVRLREYRSFLNLTSLKEEWIDNYYLYFPQSGIVFDNSRVYLSWEEVYDIFSSVEGLEKEEFISRIVKSDIRFLPACTYLKDGKSCQVIPYIQKSVGDSNLVAVVMLDVEKVAEYLNITDKEIFYDISFLENVLYDAGFTEAMADDYIRYDDTNQFAANRKNVLMETETGNFGIRIRIMVVNSMLNRMMRDVLKGYIATFAFIAAAGLCILLMVDRIFNKPARKMAQNYQEQENAIRAYHVNRLLETFSSEQELEEAGIFLDIDEEKNAVVCIVRELGKTDVASRLEKLEENLLERESYVVFVKRRAYEAVILIYNQEDTGCVFKTLEELLAADNRMAQPPLYLASGNQYENLRGISVSYMEARKAMEYRRNHPELTFDRYSQLPTVSDVVTLGIETKNKLQVLIASKETEKAAALFCHVFETTCQNEFIINPVAANNFIAQTTGMLIHSVEELVGEKESRDRLLTDISRLFYSEGSVEFKRDVVELMNRIGSFVPDHQKNDETLIQEMLSYINDNYSNPDLSLSQMGEAFDMNPGYFSQYFKQHTNKNFSQYLESIRIARAEELLKENQKSITEIMEDVGYINRNTFYKAFLRVNGISPKAYRESMTKSSEKQE